MFDIIGIDPEELKKQLKNIFRYRPDVVYEIKDDLSYLSPIESQLYALISEGCRTSPEMAEKLDKSQKAVSTHLKHMFDRRIIFRKRVEDSKYHYYLLKESDDFKSS